MGLRPLFLFFFGAFGFGSVCSEVPSSFLFIWFALILKVSIPADLAPFVRFFFRLCLTFSPLKTSSATPRALVATDLPTAFFISFPVSDFASFATAGAAFFIPEDSRRPIHLTFKFQNYFTI